MKCFKEEPATAAATTTTIVEYIHDVWISDKAPVGRYLPLVLHGEGTLQVGWQVFQTPYEESESKQLLQQSRRQLGLLLLVGVGGALLQTAGHLQVSAWTHKHVSDRTGFR